jgi:hypothetical protein
MFVVDIPGRGHIGPAHDADGAPNHKPQRSWWRSVYSRVSQSGPEPEDEARFTSQPSKPKKSKSKSRPSRSRDIDADRRLLIEHEYDFEDPPPQPMLNSHRSRRQDRQHRHVPVEDHLDSVAPSSVFAAHRSSHKVRQPKQRSSSNQRANPYPPTPPSQPRHAELSSQATFSRSDSLLGRVFPPSAGDPSSVAHGSDSGRSLPSVSTHVPQTRATPRGRLILTTPQILGKPERLSPLNQPVQYATPTPQQAPPARSEEAVHSNTLEPTAPTDRWMAQGSHLHESALPPIPDDRPVLTLNTTAGGLSSSPLSDDFAGHSFDPPVPRLPDSSQKGKRRSKPEAPSPGLRRSSAQMYSPESPPHRGRRQSVDVNPLQIPESSYTRPSSSRPIDERRGKHRMSAPLDAAPRSQYSIPSYPEEQLRLSGYQVENMRSDITQPSYSGTPHFVKYPPVMPSGRQLPTASPGFPQPPTATQLSYQRDPYSVVAGASNYSPPRQENRSTQRPPSGERTSRSKDYMTDTTRP